MNADYLGEGLTRFVDGDRDAETEASIIILAEIALLARLWLKAQMKKK